MDDKINEVKQELNKDFGKESTVKPSPKMKFFGREMTPELIREMFTNGVFVIFGLSVVWYLIKTYILGE